MRLRDGLPRGRFEAVPGHPGLRNIVGHLPGTRPAVVVAAHYDTKQLPGFVGANDGAGGTAAVMELARVLRRTNRPEGAPELRFVLFDGEEATDDRRDFRATGLRGSTAYARRHADELRAVVVLDFIADKRLRIPREEGSDPELWSRLRTAARRVGAGSTFPAGTQGEITDDHTPFAEAGVPAIDLIDFDFPCWHRTLRRPERGVARRRSTAPANPCSSCCGPGARARTSSDRPPTPPGPGPRIGSRTSRCGCRRAGTGGPRAP